MLIDIVIRYTRGGELIEDRRGLTRVDIASVVRYTAEYLADRGTEVQAIAEDGRIVRSVKAPASRPQPAPTTTT